MSRTSLLTALTALVTLAFAAPAVASPPTNDHFANAQIVGGISEPPTEQYSAQSSSVQPGEPFAAPGSGTIWFKWTPNFSGATELDTCASEPIDESRVYRIPGGQPVSLANLVDAVEDDYPLPYTPFCKTRFRAVGGTTYYVQVLWNGDSSGQLHIKQDTQGPTAAPTFDLGWGELTGAQHLAQFSGGSGTDTLICALDGEDWKFCQSPMQLSNLSDKEHVFTVRVMDAAGNLSPQALKKWKVDATAPETTILTPTSGTTHVAPLITWEVDDWAETRCSLDFGAFEPCTSPFQAPQLAAGEHNLRVKAFDELGNDDPTPAQVKWIVPGAASAPEQPATPAGEPAPAADPRPIPQVTNVYPQPVACTTTLSAPRRVAVKKARRGLKVKVVSGCATKVVVKQRGRRLATRSVAATGTVVLKAKRARRGRITVQAGAAKRTIRVV